MFARFCSECVSLHFPKRQSKTPQMLPAGSSNPWPAESVERRGAKEGIVELPCAAPEEDQSLTNVSDFPTILIVLVLLERGVERCEK